MSMWKMPEEAWDIPEGKKAIVHNKAGHTILVYDQDGQERTGVAADGDEQYPNPPFTRIRVRAPRELYDIEILDIEQN